MGIREWAKQYAEIETRSKTPWFWTFVRIAFRPLVRLAERVIFLFTRAEIISSTSREYSRLVKWKLDASESNVIHVFFRFQDNFQGKGDFLTLVSLIAFLESLDFKVSFYFDGDPSTQDEVFVSHRKECCRMLRDFTNAKVFSTTASSQTFEPRGYQLFLTQVRQNKDITLPAARLLSMAHASKLLNPQGLKPRLTRKMSSGRLTNSLVGSSVPADALKLGMHFRLSPFSKWRNPESKLVFKDVGLLLTLFPSYKLVWFGEKEGFDAFMNDSKTHTLDLSRVVYQSATSFVDACHEALSMDFWFQRFGGGIGYAVLISEIPYLVISNHFEAVKLYDYRKGKFGSWAEVYQRYYYLPVFPERSPRRALQRVLASYTKSHG